MDSIPNYIWHALFMLSSSSIIAISLYKTGQLWVRTYSALLSFLLLPIITYVITKVISGNIALSLGMVGALSIIRFRNPVKSSFELVVYFYLITIGIATNVKIEFALYLSVIFLFVIVLVQFTSGIFSYFGSSFLFRSFHEGNALNTLEIKLKSDSIFHNKLLNSHLMHSYSKENDCVSFRLISPKKYELIELSKLIEEDPNTINLVFRAA